MSEPQPPKRRRLFPAKGEAMRVLPFFLLTWLMLLPHAEAQTTNESEADAVAAIKKLGGKVTWATWRRGNPLLRVTLTGNKVTDAEVEHLKGLTNLESLNLNGTKVTDAGVKDLQAALPRCKVFR